MIHNKVVWDRHYSFNRFTVRNNSYYFSIDLRFDCIFKRCTLTNKAVWDYMTGLVLTSWEATGSWSSFSLWTWARVQTARSTAYFNGCPYIFDILLYNYICLCTTFLWPLRFGWLFGLFVLSLYMEDYLQIFKCVSFWLHGVAVSVKVERS